VVSRLDVAMFVQPFYTAIHHSELRTCAYTENKILYLGLLHNSIKAFLGLIKMMLINLKIVLSEEVMKEYVT
jgi:hypothetical protein